MTGIKEDFQINRKKLAEQLLLKYVFGFCMTNTNDRESSAINICKDLLKKTLS